MSSTVQHEIAIAAAALVVDEGLEYGAAKLRAAKVLGLPQRTPLPDNNLLEAAVREHIAIFHADTQPLELLALRELALVWMDRLAAYRPHIGGAVWHGTATRHSDLYLQLFCDDPKALEIELVNQGVDYDAHQVTGLHGHTVDALSLNGWCETLQVWVGIHLLVNDADDLRGALRADDQGRRPRGDAVALRRRMAEGTDAAHPDPVL
jgi:hypothetical protein